ncbi:hypothetical protein PsB1_1547 [Candidatus Phycosocius spiralis]|uniref:Uncharacterized protein n=2 Tax=Candidatus Phycosocius spiralis TaxID=2815099 RepID=A0ABQ4PWK0_9PROT|nr:hypothetical protein PsB1_1547 [Candidatus Phycosocius spiralis]
MIYVAACNIVTGPPPKTSEWPFGDASRIVVTSGNPLFLLADEIKKADYAEISRGFVVAGHPLVAHTSGQKPAKGRIYFRRVASDGLGFALIHPFFQSKEMQNAPKASNDPP